MTYEEIRAILLKTVEDDGELNALRKKLERGNATYQEAQRYAVRMGEVAAGITNKYCSSYLTARALTLEESHKLTLEVIAPMLNDSRKLVADYAVRVQKSVNKSSGVGLNAAVPDLNDDRAEGIARKLAEPGRLEQESWATGDQIINFEQSAVDKTVEANAEQWYSVGRKSYIIRLGTGKCCKWCANLTGRYEYPDTQQDVFRRHDNCRCQVIFDSGDGKYQDVHTKRVASGTLESASKELEAQKIAERARKAAAETVNTPGGKTGEALEIEIGRKEAQKELQGIVVGDTTVKALSTHAYERMLGREMGRNDVKNALENPLNVGETKYDDMGRPSFTVIGEKATIMINPESGLVTTMYPTHSKTAERLKKKKEGE